MLRVLFPDVVPERLYLESLESAESRGATIYAEIIGSAINSGGQRNGGSMTAPNPLAVQRCITDALKDADISGNQIDAINGHLTATTKDTEEIKTGPKHWNGREVTFHYKFAKRNDRSLFKCKRKH
jgi:3-oxoacyl-[acyl-carrier-protein] synthase I